MSFEKTGDLRARVSGEKAWIFQAESGPHVIQRVPPTERSGRKQTSTVTVSVLQEQEKRKGGLLPDSEVEIQTTKGTGPGGQNKNKVESAVRARHIPTGLEVFIDGRDQGYNKRKAVQILSQRVNDLENQKSHERHNRTRQAQIGDGGRGAKIRTYNFLESRAVDHRTGKKIHDVRGLLAKGAFELLS